jgi:putative ABC transport system permease protein
MRDLKYSLRSLARNPGFAAIAILTLGLGIGANSAIFSVVNSVLLRPLPFSDATRLTMVWLSSPQRGADVTSYPNYLDWKKSGTFAGMAAFTPLGANITGDGTTPERVPAALVSADFFTVLGAKPELGRAFQAREETAGEDTVVILSNGLWKRRFGSDPNIVGRTFRVRGRTLTIIGVMPSGFDFPEKAELWLPLAPGPGEREARGALWLRVVARLKPGSSLENSQAGMDIVAAQLAKEYPGVLQDAGIAVKPLRDYLVGDVRPALLVLLGAVLFVLLIACANIANLLLARAAAREQEIAVRSALGASRGRVVRQLLTESIALGLLGGVAGLLFALWGVGILRSASPPGLRNVAEISVDGRVLAFTLAVSIVTGILFGLVPALQVSRPRFSLALRDRGASGGKRRGLTLKALVVAEVALALVLLIVAGLLLQSFARLDRIDPGFHPRQVLALSVSLTGSDYPEPARIIAFYQGLVERVRSLPGVQSAGATSAVLLSDLADSGRISVEGHLNPTPEQQVEVTMDSVTPEFFGTLGVPLISGRLFTAQDAAAPTQVAVINRTMARRFWPGEDPVGKRFKFGPAGVAEIPWVTVLGVVGDARRSSLEHDEPPSSFLPHAQLPASNMTLVVRAASGDPRQLAPAILREIHSLDPNQPVTRVATIEELIGERLLLRRFNAFLLGAFSLLALTLAAVGIYGVISYTVSQSTRDIGIRLALGAQGRDVLRMVLGNGLWLILPGIALGIGGALVAGRVLSHLLFGITATDPVTFLGLSLFLALLACAASYIPARRAARLDPLKALRTG